MENTYTRQYYSGMKKNETTPFPVTGKKLEMIILSEVSETGKDKYHRLSLLVESKKWIQINFFTKEKQPHIFRKET